MKEEVKKKQIPFGWNLFCFAAHLIERDLFCSSAPCARLRGLATPGLGFLPQRFSSLLGDEACQFRNQQSRTVVEWRPWFYLRLFAYSFFWLSERA